MSVRKKFSNLLPIGFPIDRSSYRSGFLISQWLSLLFFLSQGCLGRLGCSQLNEWLGCDFRYYKAEKLTILKETVA